MMEHAQVGRKIRKAVLLIWLVLGVQAASWAVDWAQVQVTEENCEEMERAAAAERRTGEMPLETYMSFSRQLADLDPAKMTDSGPLSCRARALTRLANALIGEKKYAEALDLLGEEELRRDVRSGTRVNLRLVRARAFRLSDRPSSAAVELDAAIAEMRAREEMSASHARKLAHALRSRLRDYDTPREQALQLSRRLICVLALDPEARWTAHDQRHVKQSDLSLAERQDFASAFEDAADAAQSDSLAAQFYQLSRSYRD